MDLLGTILRSCDAEKYIDNFKENAIDTYVLKILMDEDLRMIGIDDTETRTKVLNHCKNLQIPTEKKRDLTVDNQYLQLVLTQMEIQLNKHYANLSYAQQRKDVDLCYVKARPAAVCLRYCLSELEEQIELIEQRVVRNKPIKRGRCPVMMLGIIGATALVIFTYVKYS